MDKPPVIAVRVFSTDETRKMSQFKNNSILNAAATLVFCMTIMAASAHASASDALWEYVADLHLHESHQARIHQSIINYADPENGDLLKKVLDPKRAIPMLSLYFDAVIEHNDEINMPFLLQPMLTRYEKSFAGNPKLYEAEYLDGLELSTYMLTRSLNLSRAASEALATRNATAPPSDKKAMIDGVQKLTKSARGLVGAFDRATANSLREKIAKNMFTPAGALHAKRIADSLDSIDDDSAK
jgi:hypothetical protein